MSVLSFTLVINLIIYRKKPGDLSGMAVDVDPGNGKKSSKIELPFSFPIPRTDENLDIEVLLAFGIQYACKFGM